MEEFTSSFEYVGSELELFARATNWKSYFQERLRPFIGHRVLEVGAGLGGTTQVLCTGEQTRWVCLEPDKQLVAEIEQAITSGDLPACCESAHGTLPTPLFPHRSFDTLMYIDVLEHIEKDRREVEIALEYLEPGGHLLVLSPAHDWLFSPFDAALGHYRRYSKPMMRALTPQTATLIHLEYLDSVGLLASIANRLFLKQRKPRPDQIAFWDQRMIPASRRIDPILGHNVGKSIIAVWKKRTVDHSGIS